MGLRKSHFGIACLLIIGSSAGYLHRTFQRYHLPPDPPRLVANSLADMPPQPEVVEDTIQRNTTLVATLVDYKVPVAIANDVANLIKPVFDVRQLRFGNPFRLEKEVDGTLRKFEYKIDDERIL